MCLHIVALVVNGHSKDIATLMVVKGLANPDYLIEIAGVTAL